MTRYIDAIDLPIEIEDAFDYLADFSRTVEWDPSVVETKQLSAGPIRKGTRFEVVLSFLGRRLPLEYEITEYERPHRLVLAGGDAGVGSVDEIDFEQRGDGTRVRYNATLEFTGLRRLAAPVLSLLFQQMARVAMRGLRERLQADARSGEPGLSAAPARR